ncbi:alpha-E domain-containing protein [Neotamlana laminarinivorans]|uniref:Alpha-E domain-containing protein n=1 Tax=Neotamlana laminarinivorans TaxID=2883124 RepID=A0A9X1HWV0_9FLAO|nr:alpha-E domain-containing protein [Tamlana laminarinivorans]MCB4797614.1 alpha-E domain-containing protein [Tamlana laminarinivorans]
MLARVANDLFWMGRYIERAEHTARFLNVNYFSSLDAPNILSQSRPFVLNSIYGMVDDRVEDQSTLVEEEVLYNVGLNPEKLYSILSCIKIARQNASNARDLISTEFYEAINKFYHFVMNYPKDRFVKNGLYDFTTSVTENTAILRGKIRGTLLHNDIFALIMLGINIERATQITRIIQTKLFDAEKAISSYSKPIRNSYEWTTLLKCAESYDMMRSLYRKSPAQLNTLNFLILNPNCPRSVMNSLNQTYLHICNLDASKVKTVNSAAFLIGKMRADYEFKTINEIQSNVGIFIDDTLKCLMNISSKLEEEYFNY